MWSLNPQPEDQLQVCGTTGEMMAPSRVETKETQKPHGIFQPFPQIMTRKVAK